MNEYLNLVLIVLTSIAAIGWGKLTLLHMSPYHMNEKFYSSLSKEAVSRVAMSVLTFGLIWSFLFGWESKSGLIGAVALTVMVIAQLYWIINGEFSKEREQGYPRSKR